MQKKNNIHAIKSLDKDSPLSEKPLNLLEPEILAHIEEDKFTLLDEMSDEKLLSPSPLDLLKFQEEFQEDKENSSSSKQVLETFEDLETKEFEISEDLEIVDEGVENEDLNLEISLESAQEGDLGADFELFEEEDDTELLVDDVFSSKKSSANFESLMALDTYDNENLPQVTTTRLPTLFAKDNLQVYLREISAFPILKPEEEVELTKKVQVSGDADAAFRLVSSHLRLVVKIAMEFQRRWMQNVLDLIQEGNIGLLRAVNKFDPDKGIKFSYYAKFWIRAYILKFIMDNWRMVKIGTTQAQRKLFYNLNKEKQKLIAQGFDPDIELLSEKLGVSQDEVAEMQQRLASTDLSLDMPVGEDSSTSSRIEYLPALTLGIEEGYAESEITQLIHAKLQKFIPHLSEKELFILENRLLTDDPVTLREIGEKYQVTRERIRQLEARLISKMRTYLTSEIDDFSEEWIQQ